MTGDRKRPALRERIAQTKQQKHMFHNSRVYSGHERFWDEAAAGSVLLVKAGLPGTAWEVTARDYREARDSLERMENKRRGGRNETKDSKASGKSKAGVYTHSSERCINRGYF